MDDFASESSPLFNGCFFSFLFSKKINAGVVAIGDDSPNLISSSFHIALQLPFNQVLPTIDVRIQLNLLKIQPVL